MNMSNVVDNLRKYLANTSEEQLQKDWDSLKEWNNVGPTVEEYLRFLKNNNSSTNMEIHFYLDLKEETIPDRHLEDLVVDYETTKQRIDDKEKLIRTTCINWMSFSLIDMGYEIYVHWNGACVKMYPGMESNGHKDIRYEHDLMRLVVGGYFNSDFNM